MPHSIEILRLSERTINQGTFCLTEKVIDLVFPGKTVLKDQIQDLT